MANDSWDVERGTVPLGAADVDELRAWAAEAGEAAVLDATGMSRIAFFRTVAGLSVRPGTRALARQALARRRAPEGVQ